MIMRRRVIGYEKALEYLMKGKSIVSPPMSKCDYIYDNDNDEYITVRYDVVGKLLMNKLLTSKMDGWKKVYSLKEEN